MKKESFYFLSNILASYLQNEIDPCLNLTITVDGRFYIRFRFDINCDKGSPRHKLALAIERYYIEVEDDINEDEFDFEDEDEILEYIANEVFEDREMIQNEFDYVANCCLKAVATINQFKIALIEGRKGMIVEEAVEKGSPLPFRNKFAPKFRNCEKKRFVDLKDYKDWKSKVIEDDATMRRFKK